MERLELLEKKVLEAANQLTALKEERQKILAELAFLEEENKRTRDLIRENDALREEKRAVASRIEKVLKKLKSLNI